MNCGDWVESCTAIAENHDGTFEIITWTQPGAKCALAAVAKDGPSEACAVGALRGRLTFRIFFFFFFFF